MKKTIITLLTLLLLGWIAMRAFVPGIIESSANVVEQHAPYKISETAQALHQDLFVVDLHSDSLLWDRDLSQESQRGQVDLPRLQRGNVGLQVFSATTKSPRGQNYASNSSDASDNITALAMVQGWPLSTWSSLFSRAEYQAQKLRDLVAENSNDMVLVRTRSDLQTLLKKREDNPSVVGAMYLIEGAHPLEGDIQNLDRLHAQGLHFVGLTHFFDNRLGGSLHGVSQQGLTDFGRAVVRRANELEMTVDIAHASPQMVRDVLALSTRPVVLSHGGFKGYCESDRNLEDTLMQQFAAQGGIIGVGYWDGAICDNSPAAIVGAIRYGIDLMGINHVALGSDYDGGVKTKFDTSELMVLTQVMLDEGFSESEIMAVMGENVKRFLMQQLPK
ncbi:peptidase M19 [Halieaceae bacterium IMCC14734]|uniref:Peptidase M19 n=1 Tax=Candidatus Litorirhabdus singularis TaxID=2518993 RepID=A0ABT3TFD0_9GAMM|nr:dipeptidase [Candidatus Litorirhabdus singularis]MCX2980525.1 peptidase M19 [Candidatus Litorirhabdus singularis]